MNAERRKRLSKAVESLREIQEELTYLYETEQECYDNLPESIQNSERGEAMSDIAYSLDDAADTLYGMIEELEQCTY